MIMRDWDHGKADSARAGKPLRLKAQNCNTFSAARGVEGRLGVTDADQGDSNLLASPKHLKSPSTLIAFNSKLESNWFRSVQCRCPL
jgi:hypothetical protein